MSNFLGTATTILASVTEEFDPRTGKVLVQEWHGTLPALTSLGTALQLSGYRTALINNGGHYRLTASAAAVDAGVPEVPTDTFTVDKTREQLPIWQAPKIIQLVAQYKANAGGLFPQYEDALTDVKTKTDALLAGKVWNGSAWVETYTDGATPYTVALASIADPILQQIYALRVQGAESFPVEFPVLRLVRTYSLAYAARTQVDLIPKAYSTAALQSAYNIPAAIMAKLPPNPADSLLPQNCIWGWVVQSDSDTITWSGKIEEQREWVFGACSTILYDPVT